MNNNSPSDTIHKSEKAPQALIDHLLESYFAGKCTEKVIKEQIETVLIAGNTKNYNG